MNSAVCVCLEGCLLFHFGNFCFVICFNFWVLLLLFCDAGLLFILMGEGPRNWVGMEVGKFWEKLGEAWSK